MPQRDNPVRANKEYRGERRAPNSLKSERVREEIFHRSNALARDSTGAPETPQQSFYCKPGASLSGMKHNLFGPAPQHLEQSVSHDSLITMRGDSLSSSPSCDNTSISHDRHASNHYAHYESPTCRSRRRSTTISEASTDSVRRRANPPTSVSGSHAMNRLKRQAMYMEYGAHLPCLSETEALSSAPVRLPAIASRNDKLSTEEDGDLERFISGSNPSSPSRYSVFNDELLEGHTLLDNLDIALRRTKRVCRPLNVVKRFRDSLDDVVRAALAVATTADLTQRETSNQIMRDMMEQLDEDITSWELLESQLRCRRPETSAF